MSFWDLFSFSSFAPHMPPRPATPRPAATPSPARDAAAERRRQTAALRAEWLRLLAEAQTLEARAERVPPGGPEQMIAQAAQAEWRLRADAAWHAYTAALHQRPR
jgi:hypothetical protein